MTIGNGRFIYANESSDKYGVILCSIGSINTESNEESSTVITSKTALQKKTDFHALQYNEPLRFTITVVKQDGNLMDSYDERKIKKWLCKSEQNWLQIDQEDLHNVWYNCILNNPRKDNIAKKTGGITFNVECDWGGAWTSRYQKSYKTVNNYLQFSFPFSSDFERDILAPFMKITSLSDGDITIRNMTSNQSFILKNCKANEIIIFDNDNHIFETSELRVLLDDWNKQFFELVEGNNIIELHGNFQMDLEYRLPIRVGG